MIDFKAELMESYIWKTAANAVLQDANQEDENINRFNNLQKSFEKDKKNLISNY